METESWRDDWDDITILDRSEVRIMGIQLERD